MCMSRFSFAGVRVLIFGNDQKTSEGEDASANEDEIQSTTEDEKGEEDEEGDPSFHEIYEICFI